MTHNATQCNRKKTTLQQDTILQQKITKQFPTPYISTQKKLSKTTFFCIHGKIKNRLMVTGSHLFNFWNGKNRGGRRSVGGAMTMCPRLRSPLENMFLWRNVPGTKHPLPMCPDRGPHCRTYTVKKVHWFPVSSRDVTNQTPPGQE